MARIDNRANNELRVISVQPDFIPTASGSVLIACGNTRVLCTAMVEEKVPGFLAGSGKGWLTAEYSMLPASTLTRKARDRKGGVDGRSVEIQRLIGRSLRAAFDLTRLGERSITIDCDVIQADGGTRTASITGGFIAAAMAIDKLMQEGKLEESPIVRGICAISAGVVEGEVRVDLCYEEDSRADADVNVIMTDDGRLIEVQGTAEGAPFAREELNAIIDGAMAASAVLVEKQKEALGEAWNRVMPKN
ncbi:MAG: ribonuclease PH [Clostridia bacterium]|nr:ribonuclease PH [Clostridia bacterium]